MKENIYVRFGKKYRKIARNEKIEKGAMQSWEFGELQSILHDETIGQTPDDFSLERDFYNPIVTNTNFKGVYHD